jgi:hypothetical protein
MFSAELDKSRSLLRLGFTGRVSREEAEKCSAHLRKLIAEATEGFCLLTDLSGLESMDVACEPFIDEVMDACSRGGVQRVIRVVPDPTRDIGFGIMSLFHYKKDVHIVTCSSLEEAQALLKS